MPKTPDFQNFDYPDNVNPSPKTKTELEKVNKAQEAEASKQATEAVEGEPDPVLAVRDQAQSQGKTVNK